MSVHIPDDPVMSSMTNQPHKKVLHVVISGAYVAFLDSDDWVTPDCYEYMLRLAVANQADLSDIMIYQVKSEQDQIPTAEEKIDIYSGRDILEHYLYRGMSEQNGAPYSACRKLYKRNSAFFFLGIST